MDEQTESVRPGGPADVTGRAREADRIRTVLESITDAFFAVDRDWRFTYVNAQADRVLGRAPGELLGRAFWDEYPGTVGTEFERVYRRVAGGRAAESFTAYYPDHDRWYEVHAYPALDGGGISVYFRDVSERQRSDELLRRSHDTFYSLIQNNPFGVYVVDADFRLRQVSLGSQRVFATVPRPLLGRDFAEVLRFVWAEPFASEAIGRFRRTLETGEAYEAAPTVERRAGVAADVVESYDWRIERITLPDGRYGVVCYFYDLSERQRLEAAVRATEDRLRLTADAIPALIAYVDGGRRFRFVNAAYRAWFGADPARVVGRPVWEVVGEAVYETRRGQMDRALAGEAVRFEEPMPHATLGRRETETSYVPDIAEDGRAVRGFVVLVYDITERRAADRERERLLESERAARAEAERAGRMKDEFLTTVSHELRTPLNAILGWAQVLKGNPGDAADVTEGLEIIERNARAQAQIIEDLLDMSRIVSGRIRLDVRRIDLASIVRAAVETVQPAAGAKGIGVQADLGASAAPVSGDPDRLQQVFWNLLTNAVKFTPPGGEVRVSLARVGALVEATVADTGEGIDPAFLPHVFDRFRQADATTTRRHGGLGLGLAIVKQLVELHGGTVRVESGGAGAGTTFVVALPVQAVEAVEAAGPEAVAGAAAPRAAGMGLGFDGPCVAVAGVRVLVVDDEADARGLVKRLLEDCKAVVTTAASAADAFERLVAERPDVLVSDIGLPETDGYALIRRVRALPAGAGGRTPAVALTAYARAEDRIKALVAGFDTHVAKPVEPAELVTMVAALAARARGADGGTG